MRSDEAVTKVVVMVTIIGLKLQNKPITLKSIGDVLMKTDRRTIERAIDWLEKFGVVRRVDGKQGRPYKFFVYPRKLPQYIWDTVPHKSTKSRMRRKVVDNNGFVRQGTNGPEINARSLLQFPEFTTSVQEIVKALNPKAVVTDEKLMEILDGLKLDLEGEKPTLDWQTIIMMPASEIEKIPESVLVEGDFLSWLQITVCSREEY